MEDPLLLIIEAVSKPLRDGGGTEAVKEIPESPDIDDAVDRNPFRCMSFSKELEAGRFSGNSALTMVSRSDGLTTK